MFDRTIHTEIIIDASPSAVRAAFLNTPAWDTWNPLINQASIPEGKTADALGPGDMFTMNFIPAGLKTEMTIVNNTDEGIAWNGVVLSRFFFGGKHFFEFHPEVVDGVTKTRFVHGENFSGFIIPAFFAITGYEKNVDNYMGLNKAFKKYVEEAL